MLTEIVIMLVLILVNGFLSMAEMSIVSVRKNRLLQQAEDGDRRAALALDLAKAPTRFLSTVQIGITLVGILTGALGGATIAEQIGTELNKIAWIAPYGVAVGVGVVVVLVTFLSLVFGELVPKRLALNNAEKMAASVAPGMDLLAKLAAPAVNVLSWFTDLIVRALGVNPPAEADVTEDDLKILLDQGTESGVIEEAEQDMVERIFRLSDRSVSALMTPRMDIVFVDIDASDQEIYQVIADNPFSRFPVMEDSPDNILGFVQSRDLLMQKVELGVLDVRGTLRQPLFVPESTPALDVLESFRETGAELGLIFDEYGGVSGMVSVNDLLVAIVGDVFTPMSEQDPEAVRREDGSWLFDGLLRVDALKDYLEIDGLPEESEGNYETLSGLMMAQLGRIPTSGDHFEWDGLRFEVMDMDGRRVDKVLVERLPKDATSHG